jgi:hypothetical protein
MAADILRPRRKGVKAIGVGVLFVTMMLTGCASRHELKSPCELPPSLLSFGEAHDCGPLLPVNEPLMNISVTARQLGPV